MPKPLHELDPEALRENGEAWPEQTVEQLRAEVARGAARIEEREKCARLPGPGVVMRSESITLKALTELPEYSCTLPTGVVVGKRWRRHQPYYRSVACCAVHDCGHWFIGEYYNIGATDLVGVRWAKAEVGPALPSPVLRPDQRWCPEVD